MITRRVLCAILPLLLAACTSDAPTSVNQAPVSVTGDILPASYGQCPLEYCSLAHPGSETSAYCTYEGCFEMTYSPELRVVAADEQGPFPRTFFVWTDRSLTPSGAIPCILTERGTKIRVDLPAGATRCRADVTTDEYLYFEHFSSNPRSGCLGWVECREPRY